LEFHFELKIHSDLFENGVDCCLRLAQPERAQPEIGMVEPLLPNMVDRADALIPVCSSLPALVFGSLRMLVVDAMGYGDSWFWIGGLVVDASVAQWRDCGPYMAAGRIVAARVSALVLWAAAWALWCSFAAFGIWWSESRPRVALGGGCTTTAAGHMQRSSCALKCALGSASGGSLQQWCTRGRVCLGLPENTTRSTSPRVQRVSGVRWAASSLNARPD
jgi:hypothetical protein